MIEQDVGCFGTGPPQHLPSLMATLKTVAHLKILTEFYRQKFFESARFATSSPVMRTITLM